MIGLGSDKNRKALERDDLSHFLSKQLSPDLPRFLFQYLRLHIGEDHILLLTSAISSPTSHPCGSLSQLVSQFVRELQGHILRCPGHSSE